MELKNRLVILTKRIFKSEVDHVEIDIQKINECAEWICTVRLTLVSSDRFEYCGTGIDVSQGISFLKALSEVGECVVVRSSSLPLFSRLGVAGGISRVSAKERAFCELFEREALTRFFRLEGNIISQKCQSFTIENRSFDLIQFLSPKSKVHVLMAFNSDYLDSDETCLIYGLGAGESYALSYEKVKNEIKSMLFDHKVREDWCLKNRISSAADGNHLASKDVLNKTHFRKALETTNGRLNCFYLENQRVQLNWLESPIHFFSFCRASFLSNLDLSFETSSRLQSRHLLHPFW